MKVNYDPYADAMYIHFSDKKSTRTEEISEGFLVDYNGKTIVGIEILFVSDKIPLRERNELTVSMSTPPTRLIKNV